MVATILIGAILCAAVSITYVLYQITYNLFFSPLRNVPGPLIARVTPRWLMLIDMAGRRTSWIHNLHSRHGPTVRIAPNELSFANMEMVKVIYGQQTTFPKAPIYDTMSLPPFGIFSMRDRQDHSHRRRLLSHAFAQSSLYESEPLIRAHVEELTQRVQSGLCRPMDMMLLFRLVAFDIVGELFLGQSFNGLKAGTPPQFLHDIDQHFILCGIEGNFPLIYAMLLRIPIPALQRFLKARQRLIAYGKETFENYISENGRMSGRKDLLTKVVSLKSDTGEAPLTDLEIYTEVSNLILAGTDTTSMTLTYMFWQLAKNPKWQQMLRQEVGEKVPTSSGTVPGFSELAQLPILDAVVKEALRLHPAAPASLPRETPQGGKILNGSHIPEGTIVSMQCYTTQRDAATFPDPNAFRPERWMAPESEAMKEMMMPFSKGSRACLGKNLAMMELKLITASLINKFSVWLGPNCTDESMVMTDHFLVLPKGGKCEMIFSRVEES
ncbi:uncharacterized protein A1O5_09503 [Cladophialophora psammophila CBS 110553]|uniref:Cytochrome P450 oxidoreductase n=1 Tax=Cladophialophora psammophila CBS 110553 TaxID=1182543 RepID=W9WR74_9EURO|nr:uncharacterized protein A1O5_09503 [Cladophialophora psammophila CBS 110553]EXJ67490.1 hypothetical protein A1O5_09503 [Cladophialophora psammophila CBS 110553]